MSADVLPFKRPEPAPETRYCWQCIVCSSQAFVLLKGGAIECDHCGTPQTEASWFFPDDDRPKL
jgi:hypothetical protein